MVYNPTLLFMSPTSYICTELALPSFLPPAEAKRKKVTNEASFPGHLPHASLAF